MLVPMDKTVCKVTDLAEQRAETYRYWRSLPSSERFEATYRHSVDLYRQKGIVANGEGSTRSFAHIQRKKVRYLVVGGYAVSCFNSSKIEPQLESGHTK
jgi:hypothetical protein